MKFESLQQIPSVEGESAVLSLESIQESLASRKPIEISIRRSSGQIESGWSIIDMYLGVGNEPVKVKVVKNGVGAKVVSLDNVQKWNSPETSNSESAIELRENEPISVPEAPEAPKDLSAILIPGIIRDLLSRGEVIEVSVKRSSGEIESGWSVVVIDEAGKMVRVSKEGAGSKVVSLDDLKKWNTAQDSYEPGEDDRAKEFSKR